MIRLAGILLCLIAFDILFYSDSKGNFLAASLQAVVFIVLLWRSQNKKEALIFILITALLLFAVPFPVNLANISSDMPAGARDLMHHTMNDVHSQDGSLSTRIALIKNALMIYVGTKGFGAGAGNAEYMVENHGIYETYGIYRLHNWWLEVLVNYGTLVFIGYVAVYLTLLVSMFKAYQRAADIKQKQISQALLLSLVAFSIGAISSSSVFTFFPQWILFGISIAYLSALKQNGPQSIASNHRLKLLEEDNAV
jgi:teichuronic acid biosynthesis protein TuaE